MLAKVWRVIRWFLLVPLVLILLVLLVSITETAVWKVLDLIIGLRVDEEIEIIGLDVHETGLEAYPEFRRA